jgi:hypothetical protein
MKNKVSIYIIVSICLFVGLLHFIIGPDYEGILRDFIRGYLIDILLPMSLYLLPQISFRKRISVVQSRVIAAIFTFLSGATVEFLQYFEIDFLGKTFDALDFVMYGIGVGLGIIIDLTIINRFEKKIS